MNFDEQLQQALRRKDAPAGFEARVLRRIADGASRQELERGPRWRRAAALGLAASVIIGVAGSRYVSVRRAAEAERNKQKVETALRIVSETLQAVQIKVTNATVIQRREP